MSGYANVHPYVVAWKCRHRRALPSAAHIRVDQQDKESRFLQAGWTRTCFQKDVYLPRFMHKAALHLLEPVILTLRMALIACKTCTAMLEQMRRRVDRKHTNLGSKKRTVATIATLWPLLHYHLARLIS